MKNNNLDWSTYEGIVRDVYEKLGAQNGVKVLGWGKKCIITGKSKAKHQIDVLTSHSDGLHDYLTDIECKYWKRKVNKDIVMKIACIVEDCNFSKGVIVTTKGFTLDAVKVAEQYGIGLVELRPLTDADWKGRIRAVQLNITGLFPRVLAMKVNSRSNAIAADKEELTETVDTRLARIETPDGKSKTFIDFINYDFFAKLSEKKQFDTPYTAVYRFEKGSRVVYEESGRSYMLDSIVITGIIDSEQHNKMIDMSDKVYFIMKSVYENKKLLLDRNGSVVKALGDMQ